VSLANLVLAFIAAVTGSVAAWFAWQQHKDGTRARYAEIVTVVGEIQHCTQNGWPTSHHRGYAQHRLRSMMVVTGSAGCDRSRLR